MTTDVDFFDKLNKMNEKGTVYGSLEKWQERKQALFPMGRRVLSNHMVDKMFKKVLPSNHTVDKLFYKIVQKP